MTMKHDMLEKDVNNVPFALTPMKKKTSLHEKKKGIEITIH